jgi:hypothetical protein
VLLLPARKRLPMCCNVVALQDGKTAKMLASQEGHTDCVKVLEAAKAAANLQAKVSACIRGWCESVIENSGDGRGCMLPIFISQLSFSLLSFPVRTYFALVYHTINRYLTKYIP